MLYRIGTTSLTSCKQVKDVNQCMGGLGAQTIAFFCHRLLTSFSSLHYFEVNRMNTMSLLFIKILSHFCTSNNHTFYSYHQNALRMYGDRYEHAWGFLGVWMCGHCEQRQGSAEVGSRHCVKYLSTHRISRILCWENHIPLLWISFMYYLILGNTNIHVQCSSDTIALKHYTQH